MKTGAEALKTLLLIATPLFRDEMMALIHQVQLKESTMVKGDWKIVVRMSVQADMMANLTDHFNVTFEFSHQQIVLTNKV